MGLHKFYKLEDVDESLCGVIESVLQENDIEITGSIEHEYCYYVDNGEKEITEREHSILCWLIEEPFRIVNPDGSCTSVVTTESMLSEQDDRCMMFEIGPRLNHSTPYSTNAVSICLSAGIQYISRFERSRRYNITGLSKTVPTEVKLRLIDALHDKMTEICYGSPVESFQLIAKPSQVYEVDIVQGGRKALEKVNIEMGLAMDAWDLDYYTVLFQEKIKRNPTNVECFDLAQSNSEHSRHWFFGGKLILDNEEKPESLFKMVKATQEKTNQNNKIKFSDNSSCIEGFGVTSFLPATPGESSRFITDSSKRHIILTAETHNFPTAVAPFPGATTGTGGRIRDVQATGRGANVVAGTAGYCFGAMNIPGYKLPWEESTLSYPNNFASPLNVIIEASNGASDYGNKYGEPVICGFARSFGLRLADERREWIKPIMFSGGLGSIADDHLYKESPQVGDVVVKVGGPVYRIGVGGGAASSIQVQGDNDSELDLGAVQRGDAEMEQKMNRIIRACIECRGDNPILSVHDQGAGGNGNVLKEICEPRGAIIHADAFQLADPTINVLELWGAEYQESNALLTKATSKPRIAKIAAREKCEASFVGEITGDGKIQLTPFGHTGISNKLIKNGEEIDEQENADIPAAKRRKSRLPVDLELEYVLGDMPRKVFEMRRLERNLSQLSLPADVSVKQALERVLKLPSVASKRYLTNKVDRSVTGLIAQQQCVGPLHTPLADVAVTALSYWDTRGAATAIGEQPIKTLVSAECGARMSVGESLTNLSFALITHLKDVKCSGNWMWPAKLAGEGAVMYDACKAMCDVMKDLGIGVDGGKDSLSMAARVGDETVKAPGSLVISTYAPCEDIMKTVTPDLKCPDGRGELIYLNLSKGQSSQRLGGSALAQVYGQIGDEPADLDDAALFSRGFQTIQLLIRDELLCSGHDVSDGGVITCLLEMAFAGNVGCQAEFMCTDQSIKMKVIYSVLSTLFHEELGYVLELKSGDLEKVKAILEDNNLMYQHIGHTSITKDVKISVCLPDESSPSSHVVIEDNVDNLRVLWEETSFQLEMLQCNHDNVQQERESLRNPHAHKYHLSFNTATIVCNPLRDSTISAAPCVAILREEGSNGDREMSAAFYSVGFEVHDVTMTDLIAGHVTLDKFQGIAFVGGFSYADVLGSAKGWAASVLYHDSVKAQFEKFYEREDTFSLGVCNGCQLMTLLGWVGDYKTPEEPKADGERKASIFMGENDSGRYESRFSTVRIDDTPAIMLQGMSKSVLGIWVAHGEGKMNFKTPDVFSGLSTSKLLPIKYVAENSRPTVKYPYNPNGSAGGAAAICSPDGRHLAMMPHPERSIMTWQWPWMPESWKSTVKNSPWLQMFENAYTWCLKQNQHRK